MPTIGPRNRVKVMVHYTGLVPPLYGKTISGWTLREVLAKIGKRRRGHLGIRWEPEEPYAEIAEKQYETPLSDSIVLRELLLKPNENSGVAIEQFNMRRRAR